VALDPESVAFLQEKRYAVLATINEDGGPQQSVMWYELDGDHILMNTRRGRVKDRNLINDARASICIEDGYRYLAIYGKITTIDDQTIAHADILRLAMRYAEADSSEEQAKAMFSNQTRITLHLSIDRVDKHGFAE